MPTTVTNASFGVGDPSTFPAAYTEKYQAVVYQGDVSTITRFMDSVVPTAGISAYTGTLVTRDANNKAIATIGEGSASNKPVPYLVFVGNNTLSVQSEFGNVAGGIITILPLTGYYRIRTSQYDTTSGVTYAINDILTVMATTINGGAASIVTTAGASVYKKICVGIVDAPLAANYNGAQMLSFTAFFIPSVPAGTTF